jgi:hypothetical protein
MLRLSSLISFTDVGNGLQLDLTSVNNVEIEKSRLTLTNTAKITLARKMTIYDKGKPTGLQKVDVNTFFKRGLKVEIKLGYDDELVNLFTGYIARIDSKIPFTIYCEDEMWNLKQNSFTKAFKNVKVAEIIKYIYSGPAQIVDLQIGGFKIAKESPAQALLKLKKYGLQCYFDQGVLIVDFAGAIHQGKEIIYDFDQNVIDTDLEYKSKDDIKIKVVGVSKLRTGGKIEIVAGDPGGEEHTLHYVELSKAELQRIVDAEINKLKFDGYKGDFTTFGIPLAAPGDKAFLIDKTYPERNGSFLIQGVKTTFGVNGYRNNITLERKLS